MENINFETEEQMTKKDERRSREDAGEQGNVETVVLDKKAEGKLRGIKKGAGDSMLWLWRS